MHISTLRSVAQDLERYRVTQQVTQVTPRAHSRLALKPLSQVPADCPTPPPWAPSLVTLGQRVDDMSPRSQSLAVPPQTSISRDTRDLGVCRPQALASGTHQPLLLPLWPSNEWQADCFNPGSLGSLMQF